MEILPSKNSILPMGIETGICSMAAASVSRIHDNSHIRNHGRGLFQKLYLAVGRAPSGLVPPTARG